MIRINKIDLYFSSHLRFLKKGRVMMMKEMHEESTPH